MIATGLIATELEKLKHAAREENWEAITVIDGQLRAEFEAFDYSQVSTEEAEAMLQYMSEAKAIYKEVLFQCQRYRIELKRQSVAFNKGQKANKSYLSTSSAFA